MSLWPRLKIFCFKKRTHGVFYVANELRVNCTINEVTEQAVATCPRLLGLLDYFSRMYVILWFFACKLLREREGCCGGLCKWDYIHTCTYVYAYEHKHAYVQTHLPYTYMHTCKHMDINHTQISHRHKRTSAYIDATHFLTYLA